MIYRNIEFYNIAEVVPTQGRGVLLQRFPHTVRDKLGQGREEGGRIKSRSLAGCEIRFVTDSPTVMITLEGVEMDAAVTVYNGDFYHSAHRLPMGAATTLRLSMPESKGISPEMFQKRRFDRKVWRIFIERGIRPNDLYSVLFHGIEAFGHELRPPRQEEVPAVRWLAYGSSITHGTGATYNHNSYVQHAARKMGVDVLNMGIGGACFCEPEVADFLASLSWDFATLELGVNMRGLFTAEEFEQRARDLIAKLLAARPGAPVILFTVFRNGDDYTGDPDFRYRKDNIAFRQILRKLKQEIQNPDLYLIEGREILSEIDALNFDLIHPSDYGHALMGFNCAEKVAEILKSYGLGIAQ